MVRPTVAQATKKPSWFAPKLKTELVRQDVSVRELARRLRPADTEGARRDLNRYLHNGIVPSAGRRAEIEEALGMESGSLDEDEEDPSMREAFYLFVDLMERVDTSRRTKKNARKRAVRT